MANLNKALGAMIFLPSFKLVGIIGSLFSDKLIGKMESFVQTQCPHDITASIKHLLDNSKECRAGIIKEINSHITSYNQLSGKRTDILDLVDGLRLPDTIAERTSEVEVIHSLEASNSKYPLKYNAYVANQYHKIHSQLDALQSLAKGIREGAYPFNARNIQKYVTDLKEHIARLHAIIDSNKPKTRSVFNIFASLSYSNWSRTQPNELASENNDVALKEKLTKFTTHLEELENVNNEYIRDSRSNNDWSKTDSFITQFIDRHFNHDLIAGVNRDTNKAISKKVKSNVRDTIKDLAWIAATVMMILCDIHIGYLILIGVTLGLLAVPFAKVCSIPIVKLSIMGNAKRISNFIQTIRSDQSILAKFANDSSNQNAINLTNKNDSKTPCRKPFYIKIDISKLGNAYNLTKCMNPDFLDIDYQEGCPSSDIKTRASSLPNNIESFNSIDSMPKSHLASMGKFFSRFKSNDLGDSGSVGIKNKPVTIVDFIYLNIIQNIHQELNIEQCNARDKHLMQQCFIINSYSYSANEYSMTV